MLVNCKSDMKKYLGVFLLFVSLYGYTQVNLSGRIIDSKTGNNIPFAIIQFNCSDSLFKNIITDSAGYFKIIFTGKGYCILKSFHLGWRFSVDTLEIKNDTNITIKLIEPLVYNQPCRNVVSYDKYSFNLPNAPKDIDEFKRITSETEKLKFKDLLSCRESIIVRIWFEPAFEYKGGGIYEISYLNHLWKLSKFRYSSNYLTLLDSLEKNNIKIDSDSLFNSLLEFKIYKKENLIEKNGRDSFFIENMLLNILQAEDYCMSMTGFDRHPALDGISYHFEVKHENIYKFITFENPETICGKYDQVDKFLKFLNFIKDKFK